MRERCWLCEHEPDGCPTPEQCYYDVIPEEPAEKEGGE